MESSLKPSVGQDVTPVISQANRQLLTPTVTVRIVGRPLDGIAVPVAFFGSSPFVLTAF
jgi:hypothetical protein